MAGLDATAFNPSKRFNKDGRPRWPSTESLAAALNALGSDLGELAAIIESEKAQMPAQTPMIIEIPDN